MAHRRTSPVLLSAALLALAVAGCKQSDSILLIEVAGPNDLNAVQLRVLVSAGLAGDTRPFSVPATPNPAGDPISLPASFTLALARSYTGPVIVSIDAYDAQNSGVGFGTTIMQHIQIGGQTTIAVMLMPGLPPDTVDAGTDAGGTGGAGGSGGQNGAAGQGGASGADGSVDAADAMGLDGATD